MSRNLGKKKVSKKGGVNLSAGQKKNKMFVRGKNYTRVIKKKNL